MAVCAVVAVACGGGGGGGGDGDAGNEGPLTPTPESSVPLTITETNYFNAMQLPTIYAESLLMLADDVMRWTEAVAAAPAASTSATCSGGGARVARWSDTNSDGRVGPGDGVSFELTDCEAPAAATRFSGTLALTLGDPQVPGALAARIDIPGRLRFGAGDVAFAWLGTLHAERSTTARTNEIWAHAAASDGLRVELRSGDIALVDRVQALDAVRAASLDWNGASTWLDMTLASDVLRGQLVLQTLQPFWASFDTYPVRGLLEVAGVGRVQLLGVSGREEIWVGVADGPAAGTNTSWSRLMQGFAWVGPGALPQQYTAVQELEAVPFASIGPSTLDVDAAARAADWQLNRDLRNDPPITAARLVRVGAGWGPASIPATVETVGARLRVRWDEQLEPGARYDVQWLDRDGQPTAPRALVRFHSTYGWEQGPMSSPAQLSVSDATAARIVQQPSTTALLLPGATLRLDGSSSTGSAGSPLVSYRWTQTAGPPLQLSATDQAVVDLSVAANPGAEPGNVTLQLEVQDARGVVDRQTTTVRAVPSPSTSVLGLLRGSEGSPVLAGQTAHSAEAYAASNSWMNDTGFSPYARVTIGGFPAPTQYAGAFFFMPVGTPLQPGHYTAPLPPNLRGDGPGILFFTGNLSCWGTGEFTIHEVELSSTPPDGNGTHLLRFSADFSVSCDGAPPITGAVRIQSSRPLPP